MTSRHGQLVLAVLVFSAAVQLISTHTARAAEVCANPPVKITLHLMSDGSCKQDAGSGPVAAPITVSPKQCVQYAGAVIDSTSAPATFDVRFGSGPSPFNQFAITHIGDSVTTGPVTGTGTSGHTYKYSSVTIGKQNCSNGNRLGLIMK